MLPGSRFELRVKEKHCWASQLSKSNVCFGPGAQEPILVINMMQVIVMKIRTMVALIKSSYVLVTVTPRTDILHWAREIADFQLFYFFLTFLYIADKQCCDNFRWTTKGLSHTYPCIHSPSNSHPGCHITLSRVPCAIKQNLVGYPF